MSFQARIPSHKKANTIIGGIKRAMRNRCADWAQAGGLLDEAVALIDRVELSLKKIYSSENLMAAENSSLGMGGQNFIAKPISKVRVTSARYWRGPPKTM